MNVLTEADLRAGKVIIADGKVRVDEGTFVTPAAKEYLKDRGIGLACGGAGPQGGMPRTPILQRGKSTYIDASTGEGYEHKPEEMTHLRGNLLVPKSHPRIALRGKLDTLQAHILLLQAKNTNQKQLCEDLEDLLRYVRTVLAAEVKEEPLKDLLLFGLDQQRLRLMSHRVRENFGIDHPVPHSMMGETALMLNLLRTQAREAELLAVRAFENADPLGIVRAMNRLSSGIYILFCRVNSGYYRNMEGI